MKHKSNNLNFFAMRAFVRLFANMSERLSSIDSKIKVTLFSFCFLSSCTIISHDEFVDADPRNINVPVVVKGFSFSNDITIDMEKTENHDFCKLDMLRCYLQASEMLKDKEYNHVYLANKGEKIFYFEGAYFKELGDEYANGQNPVYLMNQMPENAYLLDGTSAYKTWEGGWLGVAGKQAEDLNDMMEKLVP